MRNILIPVLAVLALSLTACEWTEPENIDYTRQPVEAGEGYDAYLESLRAFKETDHLIMILTMEGTSEYPVLQSQHLMSMPDSADYICMKNVAGLHPMIAEEIAEVREKKGTKVLSYVDFSLIETEWNDYEDEIEEAGGQEPSVGDKKAFFRSGTERQLSYCDEYSFDGIVLAFDGNTAGERGELQTEFVSVIKAWMSSHPSSLLFISGNVATIRDTDLCALSSYFILPIKGNKGAVAYKSLVRSQVPSTRTDIREKLVLETTVPSTEDPEQEGDSPYTAAGVILTEQISKADFTVVGLSCANAHDDYYNETYYAVNDIEKANPIYFGNYVNIRRAFSVLNQSDDQLGQEDSGAVTE